MKTKITIPEITEPMGKHWNQPETKDIVCYSRNFAEMNRETFDFLPEYNVSIPTGTYTGKMWKQLRGNAWFLCWYGENLPDNRIEIKYAEIMITLNTGGGKGEM